MWPVLFSSATLVVPNWPLPRTLLKVKREVTSCKHGRPLVEVLYTRTVC